MVSRRCLSAQHFFSKSLPLGSLNVQKPGLLPAPTFVAPAAFTREAASAAAGSGCAAGGGVVQPATIEANAEMKSSFLIAIPLPASALVA